MFFYFSPLVVPVHRFSYEQYHNYSNYSENVKDLY